MASSHDGLVLQDVSWLPEPEPLSLRVSAGTRIPPLDLSDTSRSPSPTAFKFSSELSAATSVFQVPSIKLPSVPCMPDSRIQESLAILEAKTHQTRMQLAKSQQVKKHERWWKADQALRCAKDGK